MPEISHDVDPSEEDAPDTTLESLSIEEGDRIFATGLLPPGPHSESFWSVPLCSNDGIVTSDDRPHIESSWSAHFCCDNGVITSDNRPHNKSSQSTHFCCENGVVTSHDRPHIESSQLAHFCNDDVSTTLEDQPCSENFRSAHPAPISQWTSEHHPLSLNV